MFITGARRPARARVRARRAHARRWTTRDVCAFGIRVQTFVPLRDLIHTCKLRHAVMLVIMLRRAATYMRRCSQPSSELPSARRASVYLSLSLSLYIYIYIFILYIYIYIYTHVYVYIYISI